MSIIMYIEKLEWLSSFVLLNFSIKKSGRETNLMADKIFALTSFMTNPIIRELSKSGVAIKTKSTVSR